MGWLSEGKDDAEKSSLGEQLGTLAQLVAAGAVLFSVVGIGWIESGIRNLGSVASTAPTASPVPVGSDLGLALLAVAVGVLAVVAVLAISTWYRLPDSPE